MDDVTALPPRHRLDSALVQDLLRAPTINEIMVVRSDQIYVERDGVIELSGRRFLSDKVTESIIERIVAQVGRRIDRSQPLVDARLPDGGRINVIIAPLAIDGPTVSIRKFRKDPLTPKDLVQLGSDTESQVLARAVRRHVEHRILLNGHRTVVFR